MADRTGLTSMSENNLVVLVTTSLEYNQANATLRYDRAVRSQQRTVISSGLVTTQTERSVWG